MRRLGFVLLLVTAYSASAFAQDIESSSPLNQKLIGRIKSVKYYRTYLIKNYAHADPVRQLIARFLYDESGQLSQSSDFGTGEERTTFHRTEGAVNTTVEYFELSGSPKPALAKDFSAAAPIYQQNDLCVKFAVRSEIGPGPRTDLSREVCEDGSSRAWETDYYDERGREITYHREDTKGRIWEENYSYDTDGRSSGFTYSSNTYVRPEITRVVTYADRKLDEQNNWIKWVGTVSGVIRPKEVALQYVEEREIEYSPEKP